jgi:hypothetical protein
MNPIGKAGMECKLVSFGMSVPLKHRAGGVASRLKSCSVFGVYNKTCVYISQAVSFDLHGANDISTVRGLSNAILNHSMRSTAINTCTREFVLHTLSFYFLLLV